MRSYLLPFVLLLFNSTLFSQTLLHSYYHTNNQSIIPKSVTEYNNQIVIPYTLIGNSTRLPGIAFFENQNLVNAVAFNGDNEYVINQLLVSENGNLLVSAEGYSYSGQESMYFMELENEQVINEFIFNENGNELDPFAIQESNEGVFVAGFLKERELVNNSFFNMYSEEQLIYVGEFKKSGEKIWSNSIKIDGYNTGICNAMLKRSDCLVLLCHALNADKKSSTFLIKMNFKGEVLTIKKLFINQTNLSSNLIEQKGDSILLTGTFRLNDNQHVFRVSLDKNLTLLSQSVFILNKRLVINGGRGNFVFGGVLNKDKGFDYALFRFYDNGGQFFQFGGVKSEQVVGLTDELLYGYSLSSSKEKTASIHVFDFNHKNMAFDELPLSESIIKDTFQIKHSINSSFAESTINKGVEKLKMHSSFNQIKKLTP